VVWDEIPAFDELGASRGCKLDRPTAPSRDGGEWRVIAGEQGP
jgi:hypothetical protein